MKGSSFAVTPALLICAAFPILFLLAPDGIPCVYAVCGDPQSGTAQNLAVMQCRTCSPTDMQNEEYINVRNCSISRGSAFCEIVANVEVKIIGACDVLWRKLCWNVNAGGPCATEFALQGPTDWTQISTSHRCSDDGEVMDIELVPSQGQFLDPPGDFTQACACAPSGGDEVYVGSGQCEQVPPGP